MKIRDWRPEEGDALQGDVCLFRIPDHIFVSTDDEIAPEKNGRLIIASGELSGHHHAIWMRNPPVSFHDDGAGSGASDATTAAMVAAATNRTRSTSIAG